MQKKEIERRISDVVQGRCSRNEPMARYTTLGVGGPVDLMVHPRTNEELRGVLRILDGGGVEWFALGGGSDLVVLDGGIRGVCIRLARNLTGISVEAGGIVEAAAGESFAALLGLARETGLSGLEFLAGIPGTVGGGVVTNVGAFGCSFSDRLESIRLVDSRGNERVVDRPHLRAEYRRIEIPIGMVVASARFALDEDDPERVAAQIRENIKKRNETQPLREASAGCVFRNPPADEPAGMLIDRAGLKGYRIGGASVSTVHANWIINDGGATAREVLLLVDEVVRAVFERTGVELEPEIRIVGEK